MSCELSARPCYKCPDELWQLEQSWERLPGLLDQLNQIISTQMPSLHDQLNELGIRPGVVGTVTVPGRTE